ncbi:MAG: cytochrome c [Steroidobacteraceae bacterium]
MKPTLAIVIASALGIVVACTSTVAIGDATAGAKTYAECAGCHGPKAQGTVNGQVPALAGQHASVIARQLRDYREGERWDARMESVMAEHRFADDAQIGNVAAYLAGLPAPPAGGGSGEGGERGAQVYGKTCASCHGARAEGSDARVIPRLAGQQYMYLRRQLHDAVDGRRPNFPADHIALLSPLDADDIDGLAEYLSELTP